MTTTPTLVTVPCFSGAPWDDRQLSPLKAAYPVRTMRLPEALDDVERYADFVAAQVADLSDYVLVGDSFGAVISLTLALRQPTGLRGLVLSGGFAANPLPAWKNTFGRNAHHITGALYRNGTLRYHAASLASKYDVGAEVPHTKEDYRQLFLANTPAESYNARVASVISFDVRDQLGKVDVPTLLITPEDDQLVGEQAAQVLRDGLPSASEVILNNTGHMFRFTHPDLYGRTILNFLATLDTTSDVVGKTSQ
ncbi:alpha/beta hydrolase [Gordonia sp. TBRC 11910]|uniref:Alpha/beta hydrolase n=1 Tax=Gordonia asplenii TaxID=2725283 RepID=A0A848L2E6_9ACTN|nr:alpha/beta hydrolase [Gordonia asplenii]NMO03255.1 alpha/beta hydrolase [Gordonia asplenii]